MGSFDKAPVRILGLGGEAERRNRSDFANFPECMFVFQLHLLHLDSIVFPLNSTFWLESTFKLYSARECRQNQQWPHSFRLTQYSVRGRCFAALGKYTHSSPQCHLSICKVAFSWPAVVNQTWQAASICLFVCEENYTISSQVIFTNPCTIMVNCHGQ